MNQKNANTEYKWNFNNIKRLEKEINNLLEEHKQKQEKDPKNWGFVGDLNNISEILNQIIQFMRGEN